MCLHRVEICGDCDDAVLVIAHGDEVSQSSIPTSSIMPNTDFTLHQARASVLVGPDIASPNDFYNVVGLFFEWEYVVLSFTHFDLSSK